jgi:peptidoglycan/LPS O-acetylase OafA/YrhL
MIRGCKGCPANARHAAYREDIDGLRALAVLSVIGFHFEAPRVFGGFVAGTAAASENTNRSTDLVLSSAHDLSRQAAELRSSVDRFLANVAA